MKVTLIVTYGINCRSFATAFGRAGLFCVIASFCFEQAVEFGYVRPQRLKPALKQAGYRSAKSAAPPKGEIAKGSKVPPPLAKSADKGGATGDYLFDSSLIGQNVRVDENGFSRTH